MVQSDKCTNETLSMPGAVKMERCLCNNNNKNNSNNSNSEGCNAPPKGDEKINNLLRRVKENKIG